MKKTNSVVVISSIIGVIVIVMIIVMAYFTGLNGKYNKAIELMEQHNYKQAEAEFNELSGFKESHTKAKECIYYDALDEYNNGNNAEAYKKFSKVPGILESSNYMKSIIKDYAGCGKNSIAATYDHLVVLKSNGTVVAEGKNYNGQCNVNTWKDICAVAAGGEHTVGLKNDGTVVATGKNDEGQCNVSGWRDVVDIKAAYDSTYGLTSDGKILVTGSDAQFLDWEVSNMNQGVFTDWYGLSSFTIGNDILSDTVVGLNEEGKVLLYTESNEDFEPAYSWTGITTVASGGTHIVGLQSSGTVVAAGEKDNGQCEVSEWKDIIDIAAVEDTTYGLDLNCVLYTSGGDNRETIDGAVSVVAFNSICFVIKIDGTAQVISGYSNGDNSILTDIML